MEHINNLRQGYWWIKIPFKFAGMKLSKYRKVKVRGIGGDNKLNIVPLSNTHWWAISVDRGELIRDNFEAMRHNETQDLVILLDKLQRTPASRYKRLRTSFYKSCIEQSKCNFAKMITDQI